MKHSAAYTKDIGFDGNDPETKDNQMESLTGCGFGADPCQLSAL